MSIGDCIENMNIGPCFWFPDGGKRNAYVSILCGLLFFSGWWMIIDAASLHNGILASYYMCGVFGTLSLVMVNSVSNAQISGDLYEGGCLGPRGSKIWIFLGFVMGFAAVIASCVISFSGFSNTEHKWPEVALLLNNALIFISSVLFKFGRTEDLLWN